MRIEKIYESLKNDQELPVEFRRIGRYDRYIFIEFYVDKDKQPQYRLKVWYNTNSSLFTISSYDGHQKQRYKFGFDENESDSTILEEIKNRLTTALNAFVNDINAGPLPQ